MNHIYEMALEMLEPVTEAVEYTNQALTEISGLFKDLSKASKDYKSKVDFSSAGSLKTSISKFQIGNYLKLWISLPNNDIEDVIPMLKKRKYLVRDSVINVYSYGVKVERDCEAIKLLSENEYIKITIQEMLGVGGRGYSTTRINAIYLKTKKPKNLKGYI